MHRVHAGVVELDALPDPVRPGAEDQHLGPVRRRDLGLLVVGRVVVRRGRGELGRAGVDGLVDRPHAEPVPQRAYPVLAGQLRAQRGELPVGQPGPLGPPQQRLVEHRRRPRSPPAGRPARRSGRGTTGRCRRWPRHLRDRRAEPQRPLDGVEPAVVRGAQRGQRSTPAVAPSGSGTVQKPAALVSIERIALFSASVKLRPRPSPRRPTSSWWSAPGRRRGTSRTRTAGSSPPRSPASARTRPASSA